MNTGNTIFALVALGSPRTGVLVAVQAADVPLSLPFLLIGVALGAVAGTAGVLLVGDRYLAVVGNLDPTRLLIGLLGALAVLSYLFAGTAGVGAHLAAAVIGLVPARLEARRTNLMGVLIVPIVAG